MCCALSALLLPLARTPALGLWLAALALLDVLADTAPAVTALAPALALASPPLATAASAALAPAVFTATFVAAALGTPDYSHMRDTVSALATEGRPHASLASASFIAYGALVLPLGYAFARALSARGRHSLGLVLLALFVLYGVSDMLVGIFTDDLPGVVTTEGIAHDVIARGGFGSITVIMFVFIWAARDMPEFRTLTRFARAMAALTLIFGVLFLMDVWEGSRGVWQLGFFGTTLGWVQVSSVWLALRP